MKQVILFFIAASVCSMAMAQVTIKPTVVASSGQFVKHGTFEVSYTIGEMTAVSTVGSLNGVHITQGFHQPEEVGVLTALDEQRNDYEKVNFALYPNPTAQTVWMGYQMPQAGKVNVSLYGVNGQFIQTLYNGDYVNGSSLDHFDVSKLAAGNYLISLQFATPSGQQYLSSKEFSVTH